MNSPIFRIYFRSAFLFVCVLTGCKKFVEIPPPITQLVTKSVFNNNASATSAQTAIYSAMNSESYYMAYPTGLLSDELINYSSDLSMTQLYTNGMISTNTYGPWINAYNYIYQTNAIIAGLQSNDAISPAVRQQLIGESEFTRSFWYFYLVNLYGDVPLILTTDYTINASIARTPVSKIYDQIVMDLTDAQNRLNNNFVDASDTTITKERVRPTKWAATALLSRVYLYQGKWADAEAQASAVINNTSLFNLVGLDSVFLANSKEAIWQLGIPLPSDYNTQDGYGFILMGAPGPGGASVSLSTQLISAFENNDQRKTEWVGTYTTTDPPIVTYNYSYKYKVYQSSDISEYVMMLRLGEQYLIRAEARAQQNELANAITDLNAIRSRAGLAGTVASNQTDLLVAILHERQVELFTEWGHRWLDLIRTGSANTVMGTVTPSKGGSWSPSDQLMPIPNSEILSDPNLTQNPGY